MCVAIFKPAGCAVPSIEILRECWKSNSDGAGIAISYRDKVRIRKGFMKMKDLELFLNTMKDEDMRVRAMVFHFRIGTHGHKDAGNTHPFPVSDKPEVLRATEGVYDMAIAHNGIFSNAIDADKKELSDTGQFMVDCVKINNGIPEDHWEANPTIVGWSKMVILKPANAYVLLGPWKCDTEDAGGCFYSNLTWKPYKASKYTPPAGHTGYSGYGYGSGDYDDGYRASYPDPYAGKHWDKVKATWVVDDAAEIAAGNKWDFTEQKYIKDPNAPAKIWITDPATGKLVELGKKTPEEAVKERVLQLRADQEERDARRQKIREIDKRFKGAAGGPVVQVEGRVETGKDGTKHVVYTEKPLLPEVVVMVDGKPVTGFADKKGGVVTSDLAVGADDKKNHKSLSQRVRDFRQLHLG